MKQLIFIFTALTLFSTSSYADIQESEIQNCVIKTVVEKFPHLAETNPSYAGAFLSTESTWDAIFLTQLGDSTGRFFISVISSDFENAQFWSDGVSIKVDISRCF